MKKLFILLFFCFLGVKSWSNITYTLSYDPVGDKFTVSFISTVGYGAPTNIGTGYSTVVFTSAYNTASIVVTPVNGGAWSVSDKVTGNTGTLNGMKVVGFATTGAPLASGVVAGTSYPLFTFTFGAGNNCGGSLRLFVDGTDPADPAGTFQDFTPYLNINGTDFVSTNNNSALQTCATLTVPVKYSLFNANKKDNDALLNWTVQNQDANSDYFSIERSYNGVDFTPIGTMPVNLSAGATASYNYKDAGVISKRGSGLIFYRIQEVDKDGKYTYTEVRAVRVTKNNFISLYPNPASSYTNLSIDMESAQVVTVSVIDAAGKSVQETKINGTTGVNTTRLNFSNLAAGSYMISVTVGTDTQTIPLVKTK
jgi:hypothetical protein